MRVPVGALLVVFVLGLGCGGDDVRHIRLSRVELPGDACDPPEAARQIYVEALGDFTRAVRSSLAGEELRVTDFPDQTQEIRIEVLGVGEDDRIGRSGTLTLDELPDGSEVRVLLAPPRVFCEVGALGATRVEPVVARAGRGVLAGGGGPPATAEWYDPSSATFRPTTNAPHADLAGARAATLVDGRVLLLFEGGWQLFDPETSSFAAEAANTRLHRDAQVVRRRDGTVVVTGGCASSGGRPPCVASNDTLLYDPTTGDLEAAFAPGLPRAGGTAALAEGGRVWLVGGTSDLAGTPLAPELWDPDGEPAPAVAPFDGDAAVALETGGLLAGFDGAGAAVVVAPLGGARRVVPDTPRAGHTMTALENGAVLIVGGAAAGAPGATLFRPHLGGGFEPLDFPGGETLVGHGAALLPDGAVLIVGPSAWIYRDRDLGPWGYVTREGFDSSDSETVVAADPTIRAANGQLDLTPGFADSPITSYALVAGPRYADLELSAQLTAEDGGAALLFGFRDPTEMWAAALSIGEPPTLIEIAGDSVRPLCTGTAPLGALAGALISMSVREGGVTVVVDGATVLDCEAEPPRGAAGIGLIGAGPLHVDSFDVQR